MRTGFSRNSSRTVAECAACLTAALALSYLEAILPLSFPASVPGAKLGLANLAVLIAYDRGGWRAAAAVSLSRTVIAALLFGSVSSLLFSLSGAALALLTLLLSRMAGERISYIGVSVLAAAAHNIGQLTCAVLFWHETALLAYLPALLLFAVVSGAVVGTLTNGLSRRLRASERQKGDAHA